MTATSALSPLSFPAAAFAKLAPASYLQAHLHPADDRSTSTRPSGRTPLESRKPTIHTGSLSHSNGSSVVRLGDTAVVCGVRAEILRAQDIPHPYTPLPSFGTSEGVATKEDEDEDGDDEVSTLGLLVPNLELSTGCSPSHLPGNPPSTIAQSLTHRIHSLLHSTSLVRASDLRITAPELVDPDVEDVNSAERKSVTKAYWVLYIDTMIISHDGAVFDAAWLAILAALKDVKLPKAAWDVDREAVVCDPATETSSRLNLRGNPLAMTFACFETGNKIRGIVGKKWVLADPDLFEEKVCREIATIVVKDKGEVVGIERSGGTGIDRAQHDELIEVAAARWPDWAALVVDSARR